MQCKKIAVERGGGVRVGGGGGKEIANFVTRMLVMYTAQATLDSTKHLLNIHDITGYQIISL